MLNSCQDHWTLQVSMPTLFQITVCVDVRVVTPGPWVAFAYSSVHTLKPELGLEGDHQALYGWLLRVRHRFPLPLSLADWHRVCLRRDAQRHLFSLEVRLQEKRFGLTQLGSELCFWAPQVDGLLVSEQTVIAQAVPASGSLWLGCRPSERRWGSGPARVELYLFRMWADLSRHDPCEDGALIGWNAQFWALSHTQARQRDPDLQCGETGLLVLADLQDG